MSQNEQSPKKRMTWKDNLTLGCVVGVMLATPAAVAVSASTGVWLWTFLAAPATVVVFMVIGALARTRAAAAAGEVAGKKNVVSTFAVLGWIVAAAAGVALIWFGIQLNFTEDTCDPTQSRCVAVVNGVASGESTESVGSQRFGTFLLSLVAIVPGAVLLFAVARRLLTARRA
ncbi:hypothetical protein [Amycolatopsis sp. NPDC051071]|uniref:hypothetical protein n=1 Tax=Amycolatopsis sp. NPDC051071 TaxID=3154637 RepID=UPI00341C2956